jgi:hypothetical protein
VESSLNRTQPGPNNAGGKETTGKVLHLQISVCFALERMDTVPAKGERVPSKLK